MNNITKKILLQKVAKAEYAIIFKLLQQVEVANLFQEEELKDLTLLSSQYHTIENQRKNGVIEDKAYNLRINKISESLISYFSLSALAKKTNKKKQNKNVGESLGKLILAIDKFLNELEIRIPSYDWLEDSENTYAKIKTKWENRRFQVAIMALIKAGKSTLLNSWIGKEFLPSASFAETMRIIRIRHNSRRKVGVLFYKGKEVARGVDAIKDYIRKVNESDRNKGKGIEKELKLEYALSSLKNKKLGGYGFDFLDTPGANEYGIPTLQAKVERLVKNSDVIIYLLDFTKLKTADENRMFESIKEWKAEILNQVKNRLFFVVNKIDEVNRHDKEKNMTPKEIKRYVQNILNTSLTTEFSIDNIVLISAEQALLGKLVEQDDLASDGQLYDFKRIAFGEIGAEDASKEDCIRVVPKILQKSGFAELENKVLNRIYEKRSNILISSVIDDIEKLLKQVINNIEVGKGTLLCEIKNVEDLKEKINSFQEDLKSIQKEIDKFKKKANKLIDERFDNFEIGISDLIKKAFSDTQGGRPRFPWLQVLTDLIGNTEYLIVDNDGVSIQQKIQTINNLVHGYLHNKFNTLWNELAEDQYLEFTKFSEEINKRSEPLVRSIENEINKALNIKLYPSNINSGKPTLQQFYNETQNKLTEIISAEQKSNMSFWESLLHKFLRIFGLGKKEIKYHEYKISSSNYKKMILEVMSPTLVSARKKTKNFINKKYINSINTNAQNIKHYANLYINIIEKAISTKKKGIVDVNTRIKDMETDMNRANDHLIALDDIINSF